MALEERKAIMRYALLEMWNEGNLDVIEAALAPDAVIHAGVDGDLDAARGLREVVNAYRAAFPDLEFTIVDQIAEGDLVATRYTATGTHDGELGGVAPTGRRATITGINVCRFDEGAIVEAWDTWDTFQLVRQLGLPRRWRGVRH